MAETQTIAMGIIQANALLLPVTLLLTWFYLENRRSDAGQRSVIRYFALVLGILMALSLSGLLATIGILTLSIQRVMVFLSVILLAAGYLGFCAFIGLLFRGMYRNLQRGIIDVS